MKTRHFSRDLTKELWASLVLAPFAVVFAVWLPETRYSPGKGSLIPAVFSVGLFLWAFFYSRLRLVSVSDEHLTLFLGLWGFRKRFQFELADIESVDMVSRPAKLRVHGQWGAFAADTAGTENGLMLSFRNRIEPQIEKQIRGFRKRAIANFDVEVNEAADKLVIAREPKGGFRPLMEEIGKRKSGKRKIP